MINIIDQINFYISDLERLKKQLIRKTKDSPPGTLYIGWSHGSPQYYHHTITSKGSHSQFIRKKNRELAINLANKSYYEKICKCIDLQIKTLMNCVSSINKYDYTTIYDTLPVARQAVTTPITISDEEYINNWYVKHPGDVNTFPKENVFETKRGEFVRSKSEKILADMLFDLNIPYVYEAALNLGDDGQVYPDFTTLNVRTRATIQIEHMGMMDDPHYSNNFVRKIHLYEKHGYHLGEQLLVTFETSSTPLCISDVENMMRRCLL